MKKPSWLLIGFLILAFLFVPTKQAHAYLDPGTGSFILQMLAAGVLGGLFAVKTFWRNITAFFSNIFSKNNNTSKKTANPTKKVNGKE